MSAPSSSRWQGQGHQGQRQRLASEGQWWEGCWQGGDSGWWRASGSSWTWQEEGDSVAKPELGPKRKVREGGWSQEEGGWRTNPQPDGFVIKTAYPSPKSLGEGVFDTLQAEAMENYAITKVKIRGRASTAGREQTRKQGTCSHQLTIIGRDCWLVFKTVFRQAVWDRGLELPGRLPHMRIPAEFANDFADTRPRLPPHPDDAAKRCTPQPPAPILHTRATIRALPPIKE